MALAPGAQIGSFTVLGLLGKGGMGEVYRARDSRLGREVALKILPAALLHDAERSARFSREARLLASLDHPNIGAIYGLEEADGVRALVLALVEGPTLADRLRSGALPVEEAEGIARQIAEAVEYAHERGVIHRDLKPANVKITPEGMVKVLDFGLAKALTDELGASPADPEAPTLTMGSTQAGSIMGTAAYMSPEQARGLKTDRRSDIWSFGVLFCEMLTGKRLFTGQTIGDVLASVIKDEKDFGAVPAPYRRLIARCIQKDPRQRLQAIGEARIVLENGGEPTPAAPASAPPTRRTALGWAAGGVVAGAGLASWAPWRAPQTGARPLLRLSVDLGANAVVGSNITAAISPDGRRLVYPVKGNGGPQLALRLMDQSGETLLPDTGDASEPFFSPDGQWIGFFAAGKLKKISVQGGAPVTLCESSNPRGATWSEDGSIVGALNNVTGLEVVSSDGGTPRVLTRLGNGEQTHRWPHALPGGEAVLFTNSGNIDFYDDSAIEVVVLKTGERKKVWQGGYFGRYAATAASQGHLLFLRGAALFAVPFDLAGFTVRGTPVPLVADVGSSFTTGGGQFDIASGPGVLAYFSGSGSTGYQVSWLDAGGKTTPFIGEPFAYYTPRFSHDGKRLAVMGLDTDIYISDWERGTLTRLTFTPQGSATNPVWSADDKYIAYRFFSPAGGKIGWVRANGGDPQYLFESNREVWPCAFSKDSNRLLYAAASPDTGVDLWTLPVDLSDPEHPKPGKAEQFLTTPFLDYGASISPDGRWMAYHSNESGRNEIYVRLFSAAGGAATGGRWQVSTGGGVFATWSSNGKELFYKAITPDNRMMVAEYTAQGEAFFPGKVRLWADVRVIDNGFPTFDVHPDGKRLVIFPVPPMPQQTDNVHLTFLVNFFDELRRQAPPK